MKEERDDRDRRENGANGDEGKRETPLTLHTDKGGTANMPFNSPREPPASS